jgi:hypothetical protein
MTLFRGGRHVGTNAARRWRSGPGHRKDAIYCLYSNAYVSIVSSASPREAIRPNDQCPLPLIELSKNSRPAQISQANDQG